MKTHTLNVIVTALFMTGFAFGQAPSPTLNAVFPPTTSSQPNYTDFNTYVIPNPTINGVTVGLPWSAVDKSTTSTQNYDFTDWDTNNLAQFENTNKVVNLIVMPALEGGVNSDTPSYVFSQAWANGTVSWESAIPGWTASTKYLPTTYILVSGHYQQEINTVTPSSGFDGHCVSGGTEPTFSTTGGTVTDGTSPTQCAWQDIGTHAPLQAQAACVSYPGAPAWKGSSNYANGKIVVPTNAGSNYNLHFYEQNSGSSCTSGSSEPTWPTNGGSVTDNTCTWLDNQGAPPWAASTNYANGKIIVPESAAYNLHFYKQTASSCTSSGTAPTTWNTTGDSFSDNSCTWIDNGTVIPSDQGIPVSYNLPFLTAYQKFAAAVYDHYANHAPSGLKMGYIRFGMTEGGESTPLCNTANSQSSGWPKYSKYTYLAYISDMLTDFGGLGTTAIPQVADMNAVGSTPDYDYADQEALYANNNSIGLDTNGLQVNDVTQIQAGNCTVKGSTSGDWCKNFNTYCGTTMTNGYKPICSLQTLLASTPGNDTSGETGSLSVDGTFPGLIPTASAHGATNLEIYTIDTLLAVSPNYCSDSGASCSSPDYSGYQGPYESAFETFLGITPGIYSPAPSSTLPTGTITFEWNPQPGAYPCSLANVSYGLRAGTSPGGTYYFSVSGLSGSTLSYSHTISATSGSTVYVGWTYAISDTASYTCGGGTSGHINYTYTAP